MSHDAFRNKRGSVLRLFGVLLTFLTLMSLVGCIAAVPVAIRYYKSTKFQTATAQVNAQAVDVYHTAIRMIQQRPDIRIVKQDDEKLMVEIERGEKYASIKTAPLDSGQTHLVVTADADVEEKDKEEDKELALKVVQLICDELGVEYTVVKE